MKELITELDIDPILEEEFYCLVAPDGGLQVMTLSPDLQTCLGVIALLHESGVSKSWRKMNSDGYRIKKVIVTIK